MAALATIEPVSKLTADAAAASAHAEKDDDDFGGGCLEAFFTNTDYKLQRHVYERVHLQAWGLQNTLTDADLTGQVLWPGSEILAYCLLAPYESIMQRVPELAQRLPKMFTRDQTHQKRNCLCTNTNDELHSASKGNCRFCSRPASSAVSASAAASSADAGATPSPPPYTLACHLLHSRRVLEFGSGYGLLGLLLGHFARSVTMSDHKEEVIELLRRNVLHAEETRTADTFATVSVAPAFSAESDNFSAVQPPQPQMLRRLIADLHVSPLAWGLEQDLPPVPGASSEDDSYDILVGGDICYDGSVVPLLFGMVSRYLSSPRGRHAIFLCSFITRWLVVDTEVNLALERHGLSCTRVPLESFMPTDAQTTQQQNGQPSTRFQHGNMLLIWKTGRDRNNQQQ